MDKKQINKILTLILLICILIFIVSCDDSNFVFCKNGNNKLFIEKNINVKYIKNFVENYPDIVKNFYERNGFLKNVNVLNENLYLYIFKKTFKALNPKDPVIINNTKELQKRFGLFLGYLEDSKFTEDRFVGAFYTPNLNSVFLKTDQAIPLSMDLIVELNHHFVFKNQPEKVTNYQLRSVFGFNIKPEDYDVETANYLYIIDDSITNFFSAYNFINNQMIITDKGIAELKRYLRNYLMDENFKKDKNLKWVLKFGNYGYGEGTFLYEYSFILFVLDTFGYDYYKNMIKFLYNEKYNTIDNMSLKVFGISFDELINKWSKYKEY